MSRLVIDIETRSRTDLGKSGVGPYAEDPSTTVLCIAWAVGGSPVKLWYNSLTGLQSPDSLDRMHADLQTVRTVIAHNAGFERALLPLVGARVPDGKWCCTMARAARIGLPMSLDTLCQAAGVLEKKDASGHRLMLKLCKPRRPTKNNPSEWFGTKDEFKALGEYCRQDVRAERELDAFLPELPEKEQAIWLLDQRINQRGICVDLVGVDVLCGVVATEKKRLLREFQRIVGSADIKPTCTQAVQYWLSRNGLDLPDLRKDTVAQALAWSGLSAPARRALEIRQEMAKASTAKLARMKRCVSADGRIRNSLQYHVSVTGRWAGRGIQPQNLPRASIGGSPELALEIARSCPKLIRAAYGPHLQFISSLLRPMLTAGPGKTFFCADFSSIEGRVLAWLAGERQTLAAYEKGEDLYVIAARAIYPGQEIDSAKRQVGKVAELALGYEGGPRAFSAMGADYGVRLPEQKVVDIVRAWRERRPATRSLWRKLKALALAAVRQPGATIRYRSLAFVVQGDFLILTLPSGRALHYWRPEIRRNTREITIGKNSDGTPKKKTVEEDCVYHWGVDAITRRGAIRPSYGGRWTENATQAIARDILAEAMLRVDKTWPIVLTVHDEIISEVEEGNPDFNRFMATMVERPAWAAGLPISADGWTGRRYRK